MFDYNYLISIDEPVITVIVYIFAFVLGAMMASFLTCVADRYIDKESVLKGRSHCDYCGHVLQMADLVPIFSYIVHGGKCRYCKKKLSAKYLFVELGMALIFTATIWQFGLSIHAISLLIVYCLLLPASLIDIKTMELPDRYFIGVIICWGLTLIWNFSLPTFLASLYGGVGGALVVFLLSLLLNKATGKETMGFGDIKLILALGLHLGWVLTIFHMILACTIGIIVILVLQKQNKPTPFGPSLSIGFVLVSLFGHYITQVLNL